MTKTMVREATRFRPGIGPTILTLIALPVLMGLGVWQIYRLNWKTELLGEIDARIDQAPVALPARIDEPEAWRYRPVRVQGTFDHEQEVTVFSGQRGGGWHVYTPLMRDAGPPVLVNRGLVPDDKRAPAARPESQPKGRQTVTGVARLSRPGGPLVPKPDRPTRRFYAPDLTAMATTMALDAWAPVMIDADKTGDALPIGGQTHVDIPNNHLEYAVTWFALAAVLLGVYVAYGISRTTAAE